MSALRFARSAAVAAIGLSLLVPAVAHANGRFPAADQLVVAPKDPSQIALRTTYGFLQSFDAGASWVWVCELAMGYGGTQDPAIGVMSDGTVLAGIFEGLSISHDRGCSWAFAGNPLADEYVIDVSVHRDDPSRAVAITSTGMGSGFNVILAETNDNGLSWTQAGNAIMTDMVALTVDVAPSLTDRVYVSGIVGQDYAPAIERTDDRGVTWTRTLFDPAYIDFIPFIAAVDPTNPDRVYVRLSGTDTDRLMVSDDGAQTFTEVFSTGSDLLGFALSPDGKRVAVGTPKDGIHLANAADLAFQQVNTLQSRCLTWTNAGLYACASEFTDGFTVGLSVDDGKNFTSLYKLAEFCPANCPSDSPTNGTCAPVFPPLVATLGIDLTACTTNNSSSSGGPPPPKDDPNDGCACTAGGSVGQTFTPWLALLAFAGLLRRATTKASLRR